MPTLWNKVNVGFNIEDETANFGTRACAIINENDVAVYETNTLAAILAEEQKPTKGLALNCQFLPEVGLCVAVDDAIIVFNHDCSVLHCHLQCEDGVEAFCVSSCGCFLFTAAAGFIKCYQVQGGKHIFTKVVHKNSIHDRFILLNLKEENGYILITMALESGDILRVSGLSLEKLKQFADGNGAEDLASSIICQKVHRLKELQSKVSFTTNLPREEGHLLFGSAQKLCDFALDIANEDLLVILEDYKVMKYGGIVNDSVLLALCEDGSVLHICLYTLTPYFVWKGMQIEDLIVLEGSPSSECSLLALVHSSADEHPPSSHLVNLSWPDFKVNYQLPVERNSYLIQQRGCEEILFLEGFKSDENRVVDTLRVKSIVESLPELRLDRILRRCKFEEAEKFARAFNLDLEIVYKAHVNRLSQDLVPWGAVQSTQVVIFNKILELIEKIRDDQFVAEVCGSAIPPDFDMLHTMLTYGMNRFSKVSDKSGKKLSELLALVSTISRRLDTCMLIHGSNTTVTHWIEFPKFDLVMYCLDHVKQGEINKAILIWSRHLSDMKEALTVEKTKALLNAVPKATELSLLKLWLHHFVPSVLSLFPHILVDIIQWTIQRARDLELLDNKSWPQSGLGLAKCLLRLVHAPHPETSVLLQTQRAVSNENLSHLSPLNHLLLLIDTLQDIHTLRSDFGVVIQYDQFVQEDDISFVAALLERLPLEKISSFMADFFHRLMNNRNLDSEKQVLIFIQDIVMNCEDWWFWEEAPWEARVSALIPHIKNIEMKLDAILHVLTSAPVPWTATVSQLAKQGICLQHFKASDVRSECNNVPKRIVMKKYGVINKKNELRFVRLILKKNQKTMLEDIAELAKCTNASVREDIYVIVSSHFIENGDGNKALEVLKGLENDCKANCISRLVMQARVLTKFSSWTKLSAYLQLMPHLQDDDDKAVFARMDKVYKLQMEFSISTTYEKLSSKIECRKILNEFAVATSQELLDGKVIVEEVKKKMSRVAFLLQLTREEAMAALSSALLSHDLSQSLHFTSEIQELEKKPVYVYKQVAMLVARLFSAYKPVESPSALRELFTATVSQVTKSLLTHSPECDLIDMLKWTTLLSQTTGGGKALQKLYTDPAPTAASSSLIHSSVQHIVHSFIINCKNSCIPIEGPLAAISTQTPDTVIELPELKATWQRLRDEQQDLSCIRLICEYCWSQKISVLSYQENPTVAKFLVQCIKELLRKLFRLRSFDIELALALLHFFSIQDAMTFLIEEAQSVGFNYQRLSAISQLALTYCALNKLEKHMKNFRKQFIACKWAKKLNELGLPYKDAFKDTDMGQKQLLMKLISLPSTTVELLKEFCLDLMFDQQDCLMMYLEHLLLYWEPDMQVTVDHITGEKVMVVKNSHVELQQQCRAILSQLGIKGAKPNVMTWSESIQTHLYNLWNKVNYYYFEVYLVLTDLYQRVLAHQPVVKQINSYQIMLNFLQTYTRISSPSEAEQEQWFQMFPNTNHLPPISNYRLPFIPFFAKEPPWKILKPELSLKNYKTWYNIVPNLGLDQNMLCTLTIQRLTSEQLAGGATGGKEKGSSRLLSCNNSVLQEIQECVRNIKNQEMASAALYYVVNHMPPGADQVAAATLCFTQAEQWLLHDTSEKARSGFAKVQKKYLTVCTSHILNSSGLNNPEYLQLVLHPQELICTLYNDPSILQRKTGALCHCPDINRVVNEVGALHKVNVMGLRQELLNEWLHPPDSPLLDMSCDDITQNIAAIHNGQTPSLSDHDNIIRVCYVLESMEMDTAAKYLASYANIRDENDLRPTSVRLRALQCLCTIATPQVILNATGISVDTIRENLQNLIFKNELEKLGIVLSNKGFETSDKADIVRVLLLKANPQAVQLAAAISTVFSVNQVQYWDKILELMNSYTMVEDLMVILPQLTSLSHLLNCNTFTEAWNCTLITPLRRAEYPMSDECSHRVQRALEMLYCCPIPRQVDLKQLLHHCQRLHCDDVAGRLQPFLSLPLSPPVPLHN